MTQARYRWRTRLREWLPFRPPIYRLVPKGRDCGDHEWYRQEGSLFRCYHCRAALQLGRDAPPPWDEQRLPL